MSITNYTTLRDAIAGNQGQSWSHRNDVLTVFDTFLQLAEKEIYTGGHKSSGEYVDGLRIRAMETTDTTALSTSVRTLALPTGYLEFTKLYLEYSSQVFPPLVYKTSHELHPTDIVGRPRYYTITSQIEFERVSDVAYTLNRTYYAKLTAISSSNSTNNILTNFPSIYLYGCMCQLYKWSHNIEKALAFNDMFLNAIKTAVQQDKWGSIGPSPQAAYYGSIA